MGYCRHIGLEAQAMSWLTAVALRLLRAFMGALRGYGFVAGSGKSVRQAPSIRMAHLPASCSALSVRMWGWP